MKAVIEKDLKPIMLRLFKQIKEEGLALEVDGISAYNPGALYIGGKVINVASFVALELIKTEEGLKDLGDIIRMASGMKMESWGILGSLAGLYRLYKNGVLESTVDEETLHNFKQSLDWRTFVDEKNNYAMNKATNFYSVAFSIARYRELLGWEKEVHSTCLLNHFLEYVSRYSGEFPFMDDTKGEGRFDRYSFVVPAELTEALLDAGLEVPAKIRIMLDKSAHLILQLANEQGQGISYGRSTDVYGDTAVLEVCASAARLGGIFTEEELEIAYGYSVKAMQRVLDFWYDPNMQSINIWNYGRKTDNYRNKNRILGENLSVFQSLMRTYEVWKNLGFEEHEIHSDFSKYLTKLNTYTYIPSFMDFISI